MPNGDTEVLTVLYEQNPLFHGYMHDGSGTIKQFSAVSADTEVVNFLGTIPWGHLATWIGAIAALIGAVYFVMQIRDRATNRLWEQAQLVTVVPASSHTREFTAGLDADSVIVANASLNTIHGIVTGITIGDGSTWAMDTHRGRKGSMPPCQVVASNLPPGRWLFTGLEGWAGMSKRPHAVIAFTDTKGKHWFRDGMGALRRAKKSAIRWHDVDVPADYATPERLP